MGKIRKDATEHTDMRLKESERQREENTENMVCHWNPPDATCSAVTIFASRAASGSNSSLLFLKASKHLNLANHLQASIYAKGEVTCLVITKAVFDRVRSVERSGVMEGSLMRVAIQPFLEAYSQTW